MKLRIIVFSIFVVFASSDLSAKAKIPFGERDALIKVHDLPNTEEYKLDNGNYLDLATLHKEFNIAYILPLYITEEPRIVGFDEKTDTYYDIPENDLKAIIAEQKLNEDKLIQLPFYTRYGAKLVVLFLIAFSIWGSIPSKKAKVTPKKV